MDIKYRIEFHSDWHCGSGLAAGADVDSLVVKDKNGLPFIPGKTIKGLIREAIVDIKKLQGSECDDLIKAAFGDFDQDKDSMIQGQAFFSNAELSESEREAIKSNQLSRFMYRNIARTAIDANGIAKEHSLRKMEVVVPCTLEGRILNIPAALVSGIEAAVKYIKRLGQNRHRGLGRCTITIVKED